MYLHHVDTGLNSLKKFTDRPLFVIVALCFGGTGLGLIKYVCGKVMFSHASIYSLGGWGGGRLHQLHYGIGHMVGYPQERSGRVPLLVTSGGDQIKFVHLGTPQSDI